VSLPSSSRYTGLDFPELSRNWFSQLHFNFHINWLQDNPRSVLTSTFQNSINSSAVHTLPILQISWKCTRNFLVILFTNKQTNKRQWKQYRAKCGGGSNERRQSVLTWDCVLTFQWWSFRRGISGSCLTLGVPSRLDALIPVHATYTASRLMGVFHCAENRDWKLIFSSRGHVLRDWQWCKIDVTDRMFCLADENNGCRWRWRICECSCCTCCVC